ncbi:hypothetical protein HKX69_03615 [Streptomyces argyrophyllae]|uniref:DUF6777 domain-containing protein n=1 Tax=Streptomyces argyrophylli TaxID=2726118 RepID=A0A6M4PGF8_9ACTN|nr:DUF6777 domain-containing protein [Streptomyces argyrophyllae]QJS08726.1 hypothetical protein HKX69_03615 [Streptomyces argyrophyllae]
MRIPTRSIVAAWALSVALLAGGCAGAGVKQTKAGELVLLEAATERGPDPFTDSADTAIRPESPRGTARIEPGEAEAPLRAARTVSGATPGLYRGTPRVAACDVERHIDRLAADGARADAFAQVAGVTRSALAGYLRGLTPVVLGADTRVTNHAYRDRAAARYQAVLQAGTAVLVDDRGMPRVRCACGNPLTPPAPTRGGAGARGTPWAGYEPDEVIVVAPAPRTVTSITIVDPATRTWTERRVGPDVRRDRIVPPPARAAASPVPSGPADAGPSVTGRPSPRASGPAAAESPSGTQRSPAGTPSSPSGSAVPDGRGDRPDSASGLADRNSGTTAQDPPPAEDAPDPHPVPDPARDLSLDLTVDPSDPGAADPGSSRADGSVPKASEPGTSDPGASGLGLTAPDASAGTGPSHVPGIPGLPDVGGPVPHAPPAAVPVRPTAGPGG